MLKDKTKKETLGGVRLPKVHGHTVLTLTDAKTGREVKRIEKDNLVTNAVARIFLQNYLGAIKYGDITPVRNMFGGVFLFYDTLTESENTVSLPDPASNPVIAYAGQTAHATNNPRRGNPNNVLPGGSEPTADGKGYKFVWDWGTNQGNGTISAAALTFEDFGDIGPTPNPCVQDECPFFVMSSKTLTLWGGNRTARGNFADQVHTPVCITDGGATAWTFDYSTKKLLKYAINYKAQGVNNTLLSGDLLETHVVPVYTSQYGGITWDKDTGLFYLVDFPDTSNCIISEFDPATDTYTQKTFNGTGITFAQVAPPANVLDAAYINKFAKCGDYFFVYGGTGMYRLDWTQPSDIEVIDFTEWDTTERAWANNIVDFGQIATGDGCVIGAGYYISGLKVYTTETTPDSVKLGLLTTASSVANLGSYVVRHALTDDPHIQIPWLWAYGATASQAFNANSCIMFSPYLATVQNLEEVVTKDSTMTMKVAYTITIEEPEP